MSRCYSRHSSSSCPAPAVSHTLRPAYLFSGVSTHTSMRVYTGVYPSLFFSELQLACFPRISKDYAFTCQLRRPVTEAVQRHKRPRAAAGNGRKDEGSDRHFQARSANRQQKRGPAIISRRTATVSRMSPDRYVSRVSIGISRL